MMREKQFTALPHGGDWAGFEIEYGEKPLDFSMNVNPLGIPAGVCDAIAKAALDADRYPDPLCRQLRMAISEAESAAAPGAEYIPAEWIFCGNGAADIIFRLAKALRPYTQAGGKTFQLLLTAPTFSEYETAFAAEGWQIKRHLLREEAGFRLDATILDELGKPVSDGFKDLGKAGSNPQVLFLCEPNNPTGVTSDKALLKRILDRCRQTGTVLVIDECFNGFLDDPAGHSMKEYLSEYDNLLILKAFTKLYGMAGVRLGYCLCSNTAVLARMQQAGAPWNVSSLAQAAGIAALQETAHIEQGCEVVCQQRPWLISELHRLGITNVYGEANYLLFYCADSLPDALRSRGILIRDCSNYHGLGKGWYRIAVRTHEDNVRLIAALENILK